LISNCLYYDQRIINDKNKFTKELFEEGQKSLIKLTEIYQKEEFKGALLDLFELLEVISRVYKAKYSDQGNLKNLAILASNICGIYNLSQICEQGVKAEEEEEKKVDEPVAELLDLKSFKTPSKIEGDKIPDRVEMPKLKKTTSKLR